MQRSIEFKELPRKTENNYLHVFFSGRQPNYKTNMFHFQGGDYDGGYHKICVRDITNRWYNTPDYPEAVERIKESMKLFERTIFIGSSMGGYGALKFALDCRPAKVLAFSPQVTAPPEYPAAPDLSKLYADAQFMPEIEVHLCKTSKCKIWDDLSAAKLMEPYARIIKHDCNDHNCCELLMRAGKLREIIFNA